MRILHIDQRAATEVDAQRNGDPVARTKPHGHQPGDGEDQRKGEEVPFLPKKIDVCVFKEFQVELSNQLLASSR